MPGSHDRIAEQWHADPVRPPAPPEILYKYVPPERIDILRRGLIRFTQPKHFNDPLDSLVVVDNKTLDKFIASAAYTTNRPQSLIAAMNELNKEFERETIRERIREALGDFSNSMYWLCLSGSASIPLSWSHYAESHRGLVLGFDGALLESDNQSLMPIKYRDHLYTISDVSPNLDFDQKDSAKLDLGSAVLTRIFSTKLKIWRHEEEWRVSRTEAQVAEYLPGGVCLFEQSPAAISEVVFGLKSSPALIEEVEFRVRTQKELAHIKLKKATLEESGRIVIGEHSNSRIRF